jgi:ABC-2 type transport system ATP-binding protein
MIPILEVRDLIKRYPNVNAVDGVSFSVPEGICFGLLGPNGAGKTTTIEVMEGILTPTAGQVLYRGETLGQRFREEAGILFQKTALQDFLTVRQTLTMFRGLYDRGLDVEEVIGCARFKNSQVATTANSRAVSSSGCCSPSHS